MSAATLGPLFSFFSSITWAIGSLGYSRLSRAYGGFSVNFSRALFALPLFVLAVVAQSSGFRGTFEAYSELHWSHFGWFGLSMLASYGVGDVLFFKSTQSLGVPGALAIASSFPIFTVLAGVVLNGDSVSVRQYAGLFATVAGVIFIILSGHASPVIPVAGSQAPRFESLQKGVLLAFGAAICWAINGFTVSRGGVGISPCVGNTLRMGLALGIIALIARATAGPGTPLLLPGVELKRWAWLFTLEAFGGSLFFLYGLSRSPLVIGTTLASLAPALSMPVAVMMGVERFSWRRAMGIVSVVSGVWLLISGR